MPLKEFSFQKKILPALIMIILILIAGVLAWLNATISTELNQSEQNYNTQQLQLLSAQGQLKQITPKAATTSENAVIKPTTTSLPLSPDITGIMTQVVNLATVDHIVVQSFSFSNQAIQASSSNQGSTVQNGSSALLNGLPYEIVNLSVSGTTKQVYAFINHLEHAPRLTNIQSFSIGNSAPNASGAVSISLWEYYRPVGKA